MRINQFHKPIDIEKSLPPDRLALLRTVADVAAAQEMALYIVGGFVRDLLLGCTSLDFDLVIDGDAISLAHILADKYGGMVTAHTRFRTAKWFLRNSSFENREPPSNPHSRISALDFVSARSETYAHPGALPTVKPGSLTSDLRRRDFTINTLALRLDGEHFGEMRDDLGGLDDLKQGVVRVIHPNSYIDDPTRILRAVRYEQRYGFLIMPADLEYIAAGKSRLSGLSGKRLRHELDLMLAEEKSAAMLSRLARLGILQEIHPSLIWKDSLRPLLESLNQPEPETWRGVPGLRHVLRRVALSYLLWFGHLAPAVIKDIASRLSFSADLRDALLAASFLWQDLPSLVDAKPSVVAARLDNVPLLAVCALNLQSTSTHWSVSESVSNYLSNWRHIKTKTTGHDLKKRGLPPGPAYQSILRRLREAWLDGEVKTAQEERALLESLISGVE